MFGNLNWGELLILGILGILIFGPERLPKVAADVGRLVRELRRMASGVTADLRQEFGSDLEELRALDPRRMLDEPAPAAPARAAGAGGADLAPGEPAPYDPDAT